MRSPLSIDSLIHSDSSLAQENKARPNNHKNIYFEETLASLHCPVEGTTEPQVASLPPCGRCSSLAGAPFQSGPPDVQTGSRCPPSGADVGYERPEEPAGGLSPRVKDGRDAPAPRPEGPGDDLDVTTRAGRHGKSAAADVYYYHCRCLNLTGRAAMFRRRPGWPGRVCGSRSARVAPCQNQLLQREDSLGGRRSKYDAGNTRVEHIGSDYIAHGADVALFALCAS